MVNRDFLDDSYRSRPLKSLVVWSWIGMVPTLILLYLVIGVFFAPAIVPFLFRVQVTLAIDILCIPAGTYILYDLMFGIGRVLIFWALELVLLAIPFVHTIVLTSHRGGFTVFSVLNFILGGVIDVLCPFLILPMITTFLDEFHVTEIVFNVFGYVLLAYIAVNFLSMLFGTLYLVMYPHRYREIYHMRRDRLDELKGNEQATKEYKKAFYAAYKDGQWDELLPLLYGDTFDLGSKKELSENDAAFVAETMSDWETEVRYEEMDMLLKQGKQEEIRRLFARSKAVYESKDRAARKAREDEALLRYLDEKGKKEDEKEKEKK